jgi:hypothetical protein
LIEIGSQTELAGVVLESWNQRVKEDCGRDQRNWCLCAGLPSIRQPSGTGKGWYDRLIKELGEAILVALAYDFQIVDEVPAEEWDQRVHYVITERSVVDCRSVPVQSSQVS